MHRGRRSWVAGFGFGLVLLLAAGLPGCGGSTGNPPPGGSSEVATPSTPENPAANVPQIAPIATDLDPEAVVAKVNGTEIHARRVIELAQANKIRMRSQGPLPEGVDPDAVDQQLLQMALRVLVDTELMVQEARKQGLELDPQQVEAEIEAARSQFASEDEYRKYLDEAGLSDQDVRHEAERRLLMKAFNAEMAKGQTVTEAEARKVYESRPELFTEDEQVRAAQILIRCSKNDPPAKKDEAKKRAEQIHEKLEAGEDFAQAAKQNSEAQTASNGGDLGFFPRGVMVPKFEEVAFKTKVGEISPVFETLYGFNIIKVLDRREPVLKPFDEVKPWLMVELARQKETEALHAKVDELRKAADIEIVEPTLRETKSEESEATANP